MKVVVFAIKSPPPKVQFLVEIEKEEVKPLDADKLEFFCRNTSKLIALFGFSYCQVSDATIKLNNVSTDCTSTTVKRSVERSLEKIKPETT